MSASAELVELCQAHLKSLSYVLGDISSIIYLTGSAEGQTDPVLVPVAQTSDIDPETPPSWLDSPIALPASSEVAGAASKQSRPSSLGFPKADQPDSPARRLVLPLIHNEVVLGALVVLRLDRSWQLEERSYVETVTRSLAAGCFMARQNQWLRQRLQEKHAFQAEQSDIFHNLLHQFRNPLTAIGTFGKLLQRRMQQDDPNYSLADGIVRESGRLRELVTDFDQTVNWGDADLAQGIDIPLLPDGYAPSETPNAQPLPVLGRATAPVACSLGAVLQPLIAVTAAAADERQRQFWHSPLDTSEQDLVLADSQALQEIVANLLDNAFKYSPLSAWIWLMTGLQKQQYVGTVIGDSGPGIPPEDRERLFERHYRGVQTQGNIPGTGLGLAIAHDLIAAMGGEIEVVSPIWLQGERPIWVPEALVPPLSPQAEKGTAFILWMPRAQKAS